MNAVVALLVCPTLVEARDSWGVTAYGYGDKQLACPCLGSGPDTRGVVICSRTNHSLEMQGNAERVWTTEVKID